MTTLWLIAAAYVALLLFTLAVLSVAKRADEATERQISVELGAPDTLSSQAALGRVAAEVCDALQAERVTVVLTDPAEPSTGLVHACLGAPGLLGRRVPVPPTSATGVPGVLEASVLGLATEPGSADWRFAHVPLAGAGDVVGAVTAARRARTFGETDLALIEHVARAGDGPFDRRREPRTTERARQPGSPRFRRPR